MGSCHSPDVVYQTTFFLRRSFTGRQFSNIVTIQKVYAKPKEAAFIQQKLSPVSCLRLKQLLQRKAQKLKISWVENNSKRVHLIKKILPCLIAVILLLKSLVIYSLCITKSNKYFLLHFTISILTILSIGLHNSTWHDGQMFLYTCSDARFSEARTGSLCEARRGEHHLADAHHHEQPMVLLHQCLSLTFLLTPPSLSYFLEEKKSWSLARVPHSSLFTDIIECDSLRQHFWPLTVPDP